METQKPARAAMADLRIANRDKRIEELQARVFKAEQDRRRLVGALHGALGALDAMRSLGTLAEDAERDARALLRDLGESA